MIVFVNAKLNLGLNILKKRPDGYHELSTLFYPVGTNNGKPFNPQPFPDMLEITLSEGTEDCYNFTGNPIYCPPEKNLVVKAVKAFREAVLKKGLSHNAVCLTLDKHIPDGAGLGGGSADASFTLLLLNSLNGNLLSEIELLETAATLGADCPFFILNRPVIASGIGEKMRDVQLDLSGYWAVIVKPAVSISTKEAFSGITPKLTDTSIEFIVSHPVDQWDSLGLKNDFEPGIFALYPRLSRIKEKLYNKGALYAAMSGSGSAIFGIFEGEEQALHATLGFSERTFVCRL